MFANSICIFRRSFVAGKFNKYIDLVPEIKCQSSERSSRSAFSSLSKHIIVPCQLRHVRNVGFKKGLSKTGGGGRSLRPVEEIQGQEKGFRDLLRPFCFCGIVSACSFTGAAIWQYESLRHIAKKQLQPNFRNTRDQFYGKAGSYRLKVNAWWNGLQAGQKVIACIIGVNIGVFALWRVPQLQMMMVKYFACSPMSTSPCWPMLLSAFSHYSAFHLFANMYVLWSFGPAVSHLLGPEQFLATYVTAAMVSSFTSYVFKVARRSMVPSLGASGAIMAVLGMVCVSYPDARLSIAFVDHLIPHSFSAATGMKCLILMDTLGVVLGWRFFDHAAHLGGMVFGIWYITYGQKLIWRKREILMKKWHSFRGNV